MGSGQNWLAQRGFFMLVSGGSGGVVMSTAVVASTSTGFWSCHLTLRLLRVHCKLS
ncbi:hypothetical protein HanRHA438_Chr06g0267211 [Helianthus annuus]|nr:hypothetical protein HanRHA438_Chr06g0267211 [Helianthus annuus]